MSYRLRVQLPLTCLLIAACAFPSDNAVFVTRTSLGLDVDSTPPGASLGYDRVEGYLGPRYDNGSVPSVAGIFESDGGLLDRKVRQTYATGNAAQILTTPDDSMPKFSTDTFAGARKSMFFGTATNLGVKLAFGSGGIQEFNFGFKRKEMSTIPVTTATSSVVSGSTVTHVFAPVFAHFDNLTSTPGLSDPGTKLEVRQLFATGKAAEQMAFSTRDEFNAEAKAALLTQYREAERIQIKHTLRILHCVARRQDAQLPAIWDNAEQLGIFSDGTLPSKLRATGLSAHDARALYTGHLRIIDARSPQRTAALAVHEKFVCS